MQCGSQTLRQMWFNAPWEQPPYLSPSEAGVRSVACLRVGLVLGLDRADGGGASWVCREI